MSFSIVINPEASTIRYIGSFFPRPSEFTIRWLRVWGFAIPFVCAFSFMPVHFFRDKDNQTITLHSSGEVKEFCIEE